MIQTIRFVHIYVELVGQTDSMIDLTENLNEMGGITSNLDKLVVSFLCSFSVQQANI